MQDRVKAPGKHKREIYGISGWRAWLLAPLALLVKLWCRTLRFEYAMDEATMGHVKDPHSRIFVLWHNRLFVIAEVNRRLFRGSRRKMHGLVSASSDGAWLAAFFQWMGIEPIRGSNSWRGAQALREFTRVVKAGDALGLTPDGPRGPCYTFHEGVYLASRLSGSPVILLGFEFLGCRRLRSWDGFHLPLPFSRVRMRAERMDLPAGEARRDAAEICAQWRERLRAINPDRVPHPRETPPPDAQNSGST